MSYPINYPTPQGANIQILYRTEDWVKPQGASFVWFTLIGGGGNGSSPTGGGSGAVTNCMVPAFLIPDVLRVNVSTGNSVDTTVVYQQKDSTGYTLLTASAAVGTAGGTASSSNYFSCMGFYQSVAGQTGTSGGQSASATTFLSGGGNSSVTANYGYTADTSEGRGYFQLQPIIVGVGSLANSGRGGGIGCGGGPTTAGGPGLVVIITW